MTLFPLQSTKVSWASSEGSVHTGAFWVHPSLPSPPAPRPGHLYLLHLAVEGGQEPLTLLVLPFQARQHQG